MSLHMRTTLTMLALLAILVAGGWYGWQELIGGGTDPSAEPTATPESTESPSAECSTPAPVTFRVDEVTLSVFNAGAPGGTATAVFGGLTERGFQEGEVGDAPDAVQVDGTVIWARSPRSEEVRLVQAQFEQARVLERSAPLGPGVNVLVGADYSPLVEDAPDRIRRQPPEVCAGDTDG